MSTAAALISLRVATGLADEKLHDLALRTSRSNAHHIVVLHESTRNFIGVIRLTEVVGHPNAGNRILGDLVATARPVTVDLREPAENIADLFEKHHLGEVVVFADGSRYVGLITAESMLNWSYRQWQNAESKLRAGPLTDQVTDTFQESGSALSATTPRPSTPSSVGGAEISSDPDVRGSAIRILLVEDHDSSRAALKTILVRRHFTVIEARSLQEAKALVERDQFQLVISDIGLPDGSGYELMSILRERGLVGISVTAGGRSSDISMSKMAGFSHHFTKPLDIPVLIDAIHRIVATASRKANDTV